MTTDKTWTPDRIAQIKQFARELGLVYIPYDRGWYRDAPVARNPANGKEVCFMVGYDCWHSNDIKKHAVSKDEAAKWIME